MLIGCQVPTCVNDRHRSLVYFGNVSWGEKNPHLPWEVTFPASSSCERGLKCGLSLPPISPIFQDAGQNVKGTGWCQYQLKVPNADSKGRVLPRGGQRGGQGEGQPVLPAEGQHQPSA